MFGACHHDFLHLRCLLVWHFELNKHVAAMTWLDQPSCLPSGVCSGGSGRNGSSEGGRSSGKDMDSGLESSSVKLVVDQERIEQKVVTRETLPSEL
jgi:hypothetical protein